MSDERPDLKAESLVRELTGLGTKKTSTSNIVCDRSEGREGGGREKREGKR